MIERLHAAGASEILVTPIEKLVMTSLTLPLLKQGGFFLIRNALLPLLAGIGTRAQAPIVHVTGRAERAAEVLLPLRCREVTVCVRAFLLHAYSISYSV